MNRALWTPAAFQRTSNVWWWDAAYAPSLTFGAGNAVTGWRDRTRGLLLSSVGSSPVFARDRRGPRIVFDGTGAFGSAVSSVALTDLYSMTVWAVGTMGTTNGIGYSRMVSYYGGGVNGQDYASDDSHIPLLRYISDGAMGSFRSALRGGPAAITLDAPFLASSQMTDGASTLHNVSVNGKRGVPVTQARVAMSGAGRFGVGTRGDAGDVFAAADPWIGDMREIIVYSGRVTPQLEQRIEGYLAHKWGVRLASGHPYAFAPPMVGAMRNAAWPLARYSSASINITARKVFGYIPTLNLHLPIIR